MTKTELYLFHFSEKSIHDCGCECCGSKEILIEEIDKRSPAKQRDSINNNIGLCSRCVEKFISKTGYRNYLIQVHQNKLKELVRKKHG